MEQLPGLVPSTDPQFGENFTCSSLSDEATLNELVGEVGQIQTDCVRHCCSVLIQEICSVYTCAYYVASLELYSLHNYAAHIHTCGECSIDTRYIVGGKYIVSPNM